MDVMEKDIENAHISSNDKNKQDTVEIMEVDRYIHRESGQLYYTKTEMTNYATESHKDTE